jgi:DNA-binding SARP family transcriptional activator
MHGAGMEGSDDRTVAEFRIQLLGPVRAWSGADEILLGPAAQRAVLALLALRAGSGVSRDELTRALWPYDAPEQATNVIQTYVKHLRHLLEPGRAPRSRSALLPRMGDGYGLQVPAEAVDVLRLRRLVEQAWTARRDGDSSRAARLSAQAVAMWRPPLADVPLLAEHRWVVALLEDRWAAVDLLADAAAEDGSATEALGAVAEAAQLRPLDEAAQARLIRIYRAVGRRADALSTYDRVRRQLADDLGVDPGPELRELYEAILREEPASGRDAAPLDQDRPPELAVSVHARVTVPAQTPPRVGHFTGRRAQLAWLDRARGDDDARIAVLTGPGGVGKTATAVEWAHRQRQHFADGQLFVDLHGDDAARAETPGSALAHFLHSIGVAADRLPATLHEQTALYRSLLEGRRMLLLLDNAASSEQVLPLVPGWPGCFTLVTSRRPLPALATHHAVAACRLPALGRDESVALLGSVLGADRLRREPEHAEELAALCEGLPLALRLAAARLTIKPRHSVHRLVSELSQERDRLSILSVEGDSRSLRTTFASSYRLLSPPAAALFRRLGASPAVTFSVSMAAVVTGRSPDQVRDELDELVEVRLLEEAAGHRYRIHDLLRLYARERCEEEDTAEASDTAGRRLADWYLTMAAAVNKVLMPRRTRITPTVSFPPLGVPVPVSRDEALAWPDEERANLLTFADHAAQRGPLDAAWQLPYLLWGYFAHRGHWSDAVRMHRAALRASQRLDDPFETASSECNLGLALIHTRELAEALQRLQNSLTYWQDIGHVGGQAVALGNIAYIHDCRQEYEQERDTLEHSIELAEQAGDRSQTSMGLQNLGQVLAKLGHTAEALDHHRRGLAIARECGDRSLEASAWTNIGEAYTGSDPARAVAAYQESIARLRDIGDRVFEVTAQSGLGNAYLALNQPDRALDCFRTALTMCRETGQVHEEAVALTDIGYALLSAGRVSAAHQALTQALTLRRRVPDLHEEARIKAALERLPAGRKEHARAL